MIQFVIKENIVGPFEGLGRGKQAVSHLPKWQESVSIPSIPYLYIPKCYYLKPGYRIQYGFLTILLPVFRGFYWRNNLYYPHGFYTFAPLKRRLYMIILPKAE